MWRVKFLEACRAAEAEEGRWMLKVTSGEGLRERVVREDSVRPL